MFRRLKVALRRPWRVSKEGHPFGYVYSAVPMGTGDLSQEVRGKSSKRQFLPTCFNGAAHRAVCNELGKLVIFFFKKKAAKGARHIKILLQVCSVSGQREVMV